MKHAVNKLLEINGIIKSLDPALQERASDVLLRMAFGNVLNEPQLRRGTKLRGFNNNSLDPFQSSVPAERP